MSRQKEYSLLCIMSKKLSDRTLKKLEQEIEEREFAKLLNQRVDEYEAV